MALRGRPRLSVVFPHRCLDRLPDQFHLRPLALRLAAFGAAEHRDRLLVQIGARLEEALGWPAGGVRLARGGLG
jgi:hypothetical protein